jgi:hypothetical protein
MQRWFTTAKLPFSFAQRMEQSLHFFFTMAFFAPGFALAPAFFFAFGSNLSLSLISGRLSASTSSSR